MVDDGDDRYLNENVVIYIFSGGHVIVVHALEREGCHWEEVVACVVPCHCVFKNVPVVVDFEFDDVACPHVNGGVVILEPHEVVVLFVIITECEHPPLIGGVGNGWRGVVGRRIHVDEVRMFPSGTS